MLGFSLNPLKRVNSILTQWVKMPLRTSSLSESLNPLKRVNSILTLPRVVVANSLVEAMSQSPQTGQFNSYTLDEMGSR